MSRLMCYIVSYQPQQWGHRDKRRRDFLGLAGASSKHTESRVDLLGASLCYHEEPVGGCNCSVLFGKIPQNKSVSLKEDIVNEKRFNSEVNSLLTVKTVKPLCEFHGISSSKLCWTWQMAINTLGSLLKQGKQRKFAIWHPWRRHTNNIKKVSRQ